MCGIVGYIGSEEAKDILLKGLEKLEYRGYDSAGIALLNENGVRVFKEKGRISALRRQIEGKVCSTMGIGHTRWATHGAATKINAHPHQCIGGRYTLVHNGVIENYMDLKREYLQDRVLESDTDTEVVVQLIEVFSSDGTDTMQAFRKVLRLLKGSYAIALMDAKDSEKIYVAKNKSPLLIGVGDGFHIVVSDAMAGVQLTQEYMEIKDKEIVVVEKNSVNIEDRYGETVIRSPFRSEIDTGDVEKGTYPHYMLKEINEQAAVMRKIISEYQGNSGGFDIDEDMRKSLLTADRLHIVACGTSYHAGLVGKDYIEKIARVPVDVHIASEFVYNPPLFTESPLIVFISQSGETADSRAALQLVKGYGYPTLTITNVKGSTLSRESDFTLLLHAGPEIAVASTKAYTAQIAVLSIIATDMAVLKGVNVSFDPFKELAYVAQGIEVLINNKSTFENFAKNYLGDTRNAFFIGRSLDYFVCLEAALKLKEISYIQAEGFAGGELKHGTIALIEEGTPVIALSTQHDTNLSIRGNIQEVIARGANSCILSLEGLQEEGDAFVIPKVHPYLTPLISVVPMQMISYYAALHRGCDVDKPRNLAKSVTVE